MNVRLSGFSFEANDRNIFYYCLKLCKGVKLINLFRVVGLVEKSFEYRAENKSKAKLMAHLWMMEQNCN